ncbi:MAG: hypothetical protein MMC23_005863 [Stictis urceolatum]|nr:hypothetical protein [Stictis urceolata]
MSINRFLSRRDKSRSRKNQQDQQSLNHTHFSGSFTESEAAIEEQDALKIRKIEDYLCKAQVGAFSNDDIKYALGLSYTKGDVQKTVEFLKFLQDSQDMLVTPYDPQVRLLGAVNRNMTTCYLDSLLFAMFVCHDSYEPMLVNHFKDPRKNRLAILLRLWINAVRAGKLVTPDITKQIQEAIADLGWLEAGETKQQDAGEAFTFITAQLGLPNLYMKVDLFHPGKEDATGDHKIVQERLLETPIPDPSEDQPTVTLEDCVEAAVNGKVEVRRFLEERQRRGTTTSLQSQRSFDSLKFHAVHVESVELRGSEPPTPTSPCAQSLPLHERPKRPVTLQHRAPSIIQESIVPDEKQTTSQKNLPRVRAGNVRKEVTMPAWQMFSLIPFHSNYSPENDADVAHHFKLKQPILGIRLKRYGFNEAGRPTRKDTLVDIPVDMSLPHFIQDESSDDHFSSFTKFKLSLQSAVCHRGSNTTESGHYVCFARGHNSEGEDRWLLFDDLVSGDRVQEVDIEEALKKETPYLLFYQVRPIEGSKSSDSGVSGGQDSGISRLSASEPGEKQYGSERTFTGRLSFDDISSIEDRRGRASVSNERQTSVALTDESPGRSSDTCARHRPNNSLTVEPQDVLSKMDSKTSKESAKSRPTIRANSAGGHKRLSTSQNRLSMRLSGSYEAIDRLQDQPPPSKPAANTMAGVVIAAQEKEKTKAKKKEERSKHRLSTHGLTKSKYSKAPDRECIVM